MRVKRCKKIIPRDKPINKVSRCGMPLDAEGRCSEHGTDTK